MDGKKTFNTTILIVLILLAVNLLATAGIAGYLYSSGHDVSTLDYQDVGKYTLYIGTTDKDGNALYSPEEAMQMVNPICDQYVPGYTVFLAGGHWTNFEGVPIDENTLVYVFYRTDEDQMLTVMDEVLEELNQSAILVEKENVGYVFYDGTQ
ncbi:hypothetical protein MsAg5_03000 [Methanosarcinaceae archaeon Ag5]|uniref:DUF3574 domain-containing protein n=1 Tax=Methanolapillus africanus TaxID=3028297 RepID=A0AAE4MI62_9EURY|nr:hypothetical protein [Methanosarcinaceae archaeon Ag5]